MTLHGPGQPKNLQHPYRNMGPRFYGKMLFFGLLFLLSLNICQVAGTANSTQVYYTKMIIDKNALETILKELEKFQYNDEKKTINHVKMTTSCKKEAGYKLCACSEGYIWSNRVIQSNKDTCNSSVCVLRNNSNDTCISNTTVKISGSVTLLKQPDYQNCLMQNTSEKYVICKNQVENALKAIYSTLGGLDTFTIIGFRVGSVIVDFEMTVVSGTTSEELFSKSSSVNIAQSMLLETKGMVTVIMPNHMVPYKDSTTVSCQTLHTLNLNPMWTLRRDGLEFEITNGTVSTLKKKNEQEFDVDLKNVDGNWTGEYHCSFKGEQNNISLTHKGSATIDICLKPNIIESVEPAFPLCSSKDQLLFVEVKCQIKKSTEAYNVTWLDPTSNSLSDDSDMQTYTAYKVIDCSTPNDTVESCTFINRCKQTEKKAFNVPVIKFGEKYCAQDNEWQNTKAGYKATLNCKNMSGRRTRTCNSKGEWEEEVSECVVLSLHNVLEKAKIADIGLGHLDENAAKVLHNFSYLTKEEDLNTPANLNAAVSVFEVLNDKIKNINNGTTVTNFLESSNNLLNEKLRNSWISNSSKCFMQENDSVLAESYLLSVEGLIMKSQISGFDRQNLIVKDCSNRTCEGLFNINISLDGSVSGDIKTAAFRNLEEYLPQSDSNRIINSLVVSTTATVTGAVSIVIDFHLHDQRQQDIPLICVYWDNNTHAWSEDGCRWEGPSAEGRCVCTHLSSFAILMSKTPLRVPALSLLTTVGLSISIVSLVIGLAIEMIVWQQVVKTNTLYLRHTAHVNISVCLLVADVCFLASSKPDGKEDHGQSIVWCRIFAVLKHFCYLAMFFWMFALSTTLLHQAVFLFHKVSKKTYLRFSIFLGYICPLLIVFITFLANNAGAEGSYFSEDTCWLVYSGLLKGSMFTFIIPMGTIIFFNMFSMLVVIMKLLEHHKNDDTQNDKEKVAAKTVIRSVVLLTPIFGLTWAFGLLIMILDLNSGPVAYAVNYIFIILNAFQGFYILLTTCLGDKMTREALLSRFKKKSVTSMSSSTVKTETSWKK